MHLLRSTTIHLFLYNCLFLLFQSSIRAQQNPILNFCDSAGNYTNGSPYETNLNSLLSSLTTNAPSSNRYYNTSSGRDPDRVYGLAQCRGDVSSDSCRECLNTSMIEIVQRCPNKKQAVIRFDYCLLRYSDQRFFSQLQNGVIVYVWNQVNASDPVLFNEQLGVLMKNLSSTAANEPSASMFAADSIGFSDFSNIYGLVQCVRDLSNRDCYSCLQSMIGWIPTCCNGKIGGQVLSVSCNIRYETTPFFQSSPRPPPPPVAAPPVLAPPPSDEDSNSTNATNTDGNDNRTRIVLAIVIPVVLALVVVTVICTCLRRRKAFKRRIDSEDDNEIPSTNSPFFNFGTLRAATNNFSDDNKLGEGGFGPVYKGKLTDGQEIAVKRLSRRSSQGVKELKNEVGLVAKLQHRNLVRLFGCCLEGEEMMLVYEYLPNTSLDTFLFDPIKRVQLDWETRYKIITGIARGLLYLHEDSRLRIIHRDMKASNILLDSDMNAKISDFGLAKLFGGDQTQGNTSRIAGTYGYMAPEYIMHGQFSTKSDVFSFGVLVLEIVAGRRNAGFPESGPSVDLLSYTWQHWTRGTALELVDPALSNHYPTRDVLRCIHMGLLCVQNEPAERLPMSTVVLMLNSYSITLPVPSPPAFFFESRTGTDVLASDSSFPSSECEQPTNHLLANESEQSTNNSVQSINEVTITEFDPR
ncbi:cysteine-rich receptor-like protein kinase 10 isoform X2 [Magnolia sinica]|uniref:cysteine-rich receptor-like protein kinase 10 isoform X2 n=1 Tax=Magnolia sinica TaxID=86752 RepID=UPI0026580D9C|nr:cysteine-rich receptor-like protein kinase 10 isoform X2 [Magnolia sinica]